MGLEKIKSPIVFVIGGILMAIGSLLWHITWYGHIWFLFLAIIGSALIVFHSYMKYFRTIKPSYLKSGFILILISSIMLITGFGIYMAEGLLIILPYHFGISLTLLGYNINAIKSKHFLKYFIYALTMLLPFYYPFLQIFNTSIATGPDSFWDRHEDILILVPMILVLISVFATSITIKLFNSVNNIDEVPTKEYPSKKY